MRGGRKTPPQLQRMRADDLLASCFPDQAACAENLSGPIRIPDHVLVRETINNCLHEAMDLDGLLTVLARVESGAIRTAAVDTPEPSPFCHEILNANPYAYLDDAPLEERRARAVQLRRTFRDDLDGAGILDAAVIAEVAEESWPVVRDADELHDALLTLVALPHGALTRFRTEPIEIHAYYAELAQQRRAGTLRAENRDFWVAAERLELARLVYPQSTLLDDDAEMQAVPQPGLPETREQAFAEILRGWLESSGPLTVDELVESFGVERSLIEAALLRLETEGQLLRGRFRGGDTEEWCNRRVLARIHRRTIGQLRREIEPVTAAEYHRFLYRWQHVAPTSRLHGVDGTLQIIRQLEGYEIPAAAWETQILPARVANYRSEYLDKLCYSGEVLWGRLAPHPALSAEDPESARRIRPTKLAPISLVTREDAQELIVRRDAGVTGLSHAARDVLEAIERRGAPFFSDIVRATKRLPAEVEEALWQLVAAGLVTADGFDALRSLIDAKRRLGEKGLRARPRSSSGRWTLLTSDAEKIDPDKFARRLLARWGVVFRDVIARESLAPAWRELLLALRRMEARGEIRGGRFVHGFVGEQFALPEAIDALRASRRAADDGDLVRVGAYDPLHLAGLSCRVPSASRWRFRLDEACRSLGACGDDTRFGDAGYRCNGGQRGAAGSPARYPCRFRRYAMDRRRLLAVSVRAHSRRRISGRSFGTAQNVFARRLHFCRRLARMRGFANRGRARRGAVHSGHRRRAARAGKFGAHHRFVRRARSRRGNRNVVGIPGGYHGTWSAARRMARAGVFVASGFPHQSSDRAGGFRHLRRAHSGKP